MLKWVRIYPVDVVKIGRVHTKVPSQNTLFYARERVRRAVHNSSLSMLRNLIKYIHHLQ